jgi:RNA polymerase sigma-70 factor, ECF subfamily
MQLDQAISDAPLRPPPVAHAPSDETLVRSIAKGDRDAMRLLFTRHNVRVFRFLLRIVGHHAAAEDLLNEVFLVIWQGAERFEGRSQVLTWILSIARFKALSMLRRRSCAALDDNIAAAIEDPSADPEVAAQGSERSALLKACINELSAPRRQVVDLVYYHEQSVEDVARIIGIPQNTVKTRMFHARKCIAEMMAARGVKSTALLP